MFKGYTDNLEFLLLLKNNNVDLLAQLLLDVEKQIVGLCPNPVALCLLIRLCHKLSSCSSLPGWKAEVQFTEKMSVNSVESKRKI